MRAIRGKTRLGSLTCFHQKGKPGDLATRNLGLVPELLGRTDEKLEDLQFNHHVQKRSFPFMLLPQCVWWLHLANEAVDCHNSAPSSLETSLKPKCLSALRQSCRSCRMAWSWSHMNEEKQWTVDVPMPQVLNETVEVVRLVPGGEV